MTEANVISVWKYDRVWTAFVKVPYSAVLQQWTRHRSFSFSVESSRAVDLELTYTPLWRSQETKRMFSQSKIEGVKELTANLLWKAAKYNNLLYSYLLKGLGVHKQHYNLPIKPFSMVDMYVTGSPYAWNHFFNLRCSEKDGAQSDIAYITQKLRDLFNQEKTQESQFNFINGPYIKTPVNLEEFVEHKHDFFEPAYRDKFGELVEAIARVGRVSTGSGGQLITPESAERFVKRAITLNHASVFEHHWTPTRSPVRRYGPLQGAKSVRYLLGL